MTDTPDATVPPPMSALPEGTPVGRFELVRVLAETPLGIEYRAVDRAQGTEVVLREYLPRRFAHRVGTAVRPRSAADAEALARGLKAFADEARVLMHIEHPSLVRVVDVLEANHTAYLATLHRDGSSLRQLRPLRREPPSEPALRALLDAVLGALEALHRGGIVHGAVSPDHILLLADDQPLLLEPDPVDAETAHDHIESLAAAAASPFAAPELLAASPSVPVGPWTDLYSVAQTMRFWISGELPVPAAAPPGGLPRESMTEMVRRLFISARYSTQLLDELESALAIDPVARPESVAQFRRALGTRPSILPFPERLAASPLPPAPTPGDADPAGRIEPPFHASRPPAPPRSAFPRVDPGPRGAPSRAARPARPARHGGRRAMWAVGAVVLLVALSYAAWQFGPPMLIAGREPVAAPAAPTPQPVTEAPPQVAVTVDPTPAPAPAPAPAPVPASALLSSPPPSSPPSSSEPPRPSYPIPNP